MIPIYKCLSKINRTRYVGRNYVSFTKYEDPVNYNDGIDISARRIVVTGMGMVSPVGLTALESWTAIVAGKCGIKKLGPPFETLPCSVAGMISLGKEKHQLNLSQHFTRGDLTKMSLSSVYTMIAAKEALDDAHWSPKTEVELERTGVAVGTGMVDLQEVCRTFTEFSKGYKKINPSSLPKILPNMGAGHITMKYGFRGPHHSVSTSCSTGLHSIGDAYRFIKFGDAEVMVCGGGDASICPLTMAAFCRLKSLCTTSNDDPLKASRPFSEDRDGFVIGEGAGILILEELQHAKKRKANIYAEILGYGLSSDGASITLPKDDGTGAVLSMKRAVKNAGLKLHDVGYVNAHATSSKLGDPTEVMAIKELFQDHAQKLYVSSTKGAHGHLLGAAGNVETIFTIKAVSTGLIPPTINMWVKPEMDLNFVPNVYNCWKTTKRKVALKNSFGFGGTNACLCVGEFVEDVKKFAEMGKNYAPKATAWFVSNRL